MPTPSFADAAKELRALSPKELEERAAKVNARDGALLDIVSHVKDALQQQVASLAEEVQGLRHRVAELEARPQLKYHGVWASDMRYRAGALVTFAGSMWHCNSECISIRPGTADPASRVSTLVVKKGADGKSAG